jgi:pyrroline-5-carboxylate reductase
MRLVVVGGGRMGAALVGGLLRSGWAIPTDLGVLEKRPEGRKELADRFPSVPVLESLSEGDAASAVLAVKPADAEEACGVVAAGGVRRVLSVMAGVSIARMEAHLPPATVVLRAMSNTPALLGVGAAAVAGGTHATDDDLAWAEGLLSSTGVVARVPEKLLDAVTGLSGSGPAYVFVMAEALIDAGVLAGLDADVARMLVVQTLLGSARMLSETGEPPQVLQEAVTSPGGTTAEGVRVLEQRGMRSALIEAVAAAVERSRVLGSDALPTSPAGGGTAHG